MPSGGRSSILPPNASHRFLCLTASLACGLAALFGSSPLEADELVTFTSGFQLTVSGHRLQDAQYVLLEGSGAIQVPQQVVASIEPVPTLPLPISDAAPAPAPPTPSPVTLPQLHSLLTEAAEDAGLPATLVLSVAKVESDFVVNAKSPKGAVGLMQLMPATAATLGVAPDDVHANAFGGALYLRQLLIRYRGEARLALAAYNAGPALVDRFHDVPPIAETQRYVELVLREYDRLEAARRAADSKTAGSTAGRSLASFPAAPGPRPSGPTNAGIGN